MCVYVCEVQKRKSSISTRVAYIIRCCFTARHINYIRGWIAQLSSTQSLHSKMFFMPCFSSTPLQTTYTVALPQPMYLNKHTMQQNIIYKLHHTGEHNTSTVQSYRCMHAHKICTVLRTQDVSNVSASISITIKSSMIHLSIISLIYSQNSK